MHSLDICWHTEKGADDSFIPLFEVNSIEVIDDGQQDKGMHAGLGGCGSAHLKMI